MTITAIDRGASARHDVARVLALSACAMAYGALGLCLAVLHAGGSGVLPAMTAADERVQCLVGFGCVAALVTLRGGGRMGGLGQVVVLSAAALVLAGQLDALERCRGDALDDVLCALIVAHMLNVGCATATVLVSGIRSVPARTGAALWATASVAWVWVGALRWSFA